jgi:carboxypeptidase C (cathepsin A)
MYLRGVFGCSVILCLAITASASPAESVHQVFTSQVHTHTKLRYVRDSGVCETTPGVHQVSGYVDIGKNMSMWFWFFESRHAPETAPFTLWLNGGPGCSSMIGLFQENGPCHVLPDGKSTTFNPYSWNNISNMIYIDQPIGTGFSYGTDTINSSQTAAGPVWTAFQLLFESGQFAKYRSREFIFSTESYGGHYGPAFVTYFDQQNAKINKGILKGEKIVVSALLINNGWHDPIIQNKAYVDFATNAPGYGQLQSDDVIKKLNEDLPKCTALEEACYAAGYAAGNNAKSDKICKAADDYCGNYIQTPAIGNRDPYDLRQNSSALFPPEYYINFLSDPSILKKIGATSTYSECANPPYDLFENSGDGGRTLLPQLSALVNSKLKTLIWAGDADIICNWLGGHATVLAMKWYGSETLHKTPLTKMTIDGKAVAEIQNVDNFSFARVYKAGHEVPAFQPKTSLEIFSQVIRKEQLHSV